MKFILLIPLIILTFYQSFGQTTEGDDNRSFYEKSQAIDYSASAFDPIHLDRFGPSIKVVQTDLPDDELYKKSMQWCKEYFQNSHSFLKDSIENKYIKISPIKFNAVQYQLDKRYKADLTIKYVLKFEFKKGSVTLSFKIIDISAGKLSTNIMFWFDENGFYNYNLYNTAKETLEKTLNEIQLSYFNSINVEK